ncbi:tyrosine-type recombinase/integrase [Novosphingobium indicum]|nr:site-specific integrase [Novosphingobium indicum]
MTRFFPGARTPETWSASMRRTKKIDLAGVDIASLSLPSNGEKLIYDSEALGLALRLRASGSRTWIVFESQGGKTRRKTLGDASSLPVQSARAFCTPPLPAPQKDNPELYSETASVAEVMAGYLAFGEERRWKPSTGRIMEGAARLHILPALGARQVRAITRSEVMKWHQELTRTTSAARMALSTLSGMMLYAEDHGLRKGGSNPCRGLRKKTRGERGSHLTPATMRRLWKAIEGHAELYRDPCDVIRLLLLTGARKSEILTLEWDRVEDGRAVLEDSKSGPRTVWLCAPAAAILDRRRSLSGTRFVFPGMNDDAPRSSVDFAWKKIRKAAGGPTLRLHDLRHHFASIGVTSGLDLKVVGALLGHHDIDSTLVYAHMPTSAIRRSANRVSQLIDDALSDPGAPSSTQHRPSRGRSQQRVQSFEGSHKEVGNG